MYEEIDDEIKVGVRFTTDRRIEPVWFFWRGRKYKVKASEHKRKTIEGETPVHHFSVLANDQFYQLVFDGLELNWRLERIWSERE